MLIETRNLSKTYAGFGRRSKSTAAVKQANIIIRPGETVGLFGESGSGKSTLGMMVVGLVKPSSGIILCNDQSLRMPYPKRERRALQVLFQHPEVSFNPALALVHSMVEPYRIAGVQDVETRLLADLERFGLNQAHLTRRPDQLSGGELQRAALIRILVLEPKLIVLDEPTSMLDVITQAQIMAMLREYQANHQTSYLMITHNRSLCEQVSDRIYQVDQGIFTEE